MPQPIRPRRSALYMPASNARAIEKARTLPVDVVILDLEDAVAPEAKAEARAHAVQAVKDGGFGRRELVVRVNTPASPWFEADMAAVAACGADAILVPKVGLSETLAMASALMDRLGAPKATRLWAMIETPLAILNLRELAASRHVAGSRLAGFVLGANDLAKETGARITPGRAALLPWIALTLAAARAHGLIALDGVFNDFKDLDGLETEAIQGRDLGFDGKTLSHPGQAEVVNGVFSPSEAEIRKARQIIDAFARPENAGKGAIALDGWMVERLHAEMAERTLAIDAAIRAG
jgi:citrate lyase subunit beta/citryl-CoA lyase